MDSLVRGVPLLGGMGLEAAILRRRAVATGTAAFEYELSDTLASVNPLRVAARLALPAVLPAFVLRKGRLAKASLAVGAAAAVITTASDMVARHLDRPSTHRAPREQDNRLKMKELSRSISSTGGTVTVALIGAVACATWEDLTGDTFFWNLRVRESKHPGPILLTISVLAWDFIYYWNHRMMHSHRVLWSIHGVHHSSRRFNLSTAVRQPVTDRLGICIPYGVLCVFGIPPETVQRARDINLGYQWILHTGLIPKLGRIDRVINTPSDHRVHHAMNERYLDRNLGSATVIWDRLFGTYEPENEPVRYGASDVPATNNPLRLMYGAQFDMLRDISRSRTWRIRLKHLFASPAWAQAHRASVS